ncbi:MAG TPA: AAA family ATPase [Allosphingosinicella sp.]|jgi:class 3 adenylate cyclase/tetratricopeptide (TPR) repeat protein
MPQPPLEALHVHGESGDAPRRRYLTILFSDLSESTRLAGRLEAEDYFDLIARLRACYHAAVERHGGTVAQISGDGMLALFGWPEAREGDGRRAVEAALDLHEAVEALGGAAPLRLHSGIHSGLVILHAGDACRGRFELPGHATNIASRLCSEARPGEILVSEATLGPDRHGFSTGARRRLRLRGAGEAIPTRAVTGRAPGAKAEPAPFIGREAELAALAAPCADAAAGMARFVLIEGPPGVGKTRLADEFLRRAAAAGGDVHRGHCDAAAGPLHPFLEIARSILGIAGVGAPEEEKRIGTALQEIDPALARDADAFRRLLSPRREWRPSDAHALARLAGREAARAPLILYLDDWHAADDASRETMALLRTLSGTALLVVATARDDSLAAAPCAGFETVRLAPFTAAETGAAVARLLPSADPFTVDEIAAASGGNALFIEELCHAMAAGGVRERPQGGTPWLANLIESRVSRLPVEAAELVRIAAVIGNAVPAWLLEAIAGRGEADPLVRALAGQDFLYPGERPGTLRFKHGITREVIYDSVGLHQRRALHARIAQVLRAQAAAAGEEEPVEALAYHYGAAGALEATASYAERAGDKALAASALDRAQAHYRAALAALDTLPVDPERYDRIVRNYGLAGIFDPARDQLPIFERAAARARERRDPAAIAWAEYWLGYIAYGLGEPEAAIAHCSRALQSALGSTDGRLVVQIRATLGQAKAASGDYRGALRLLDEAIEVKRRHRTGRHASVGFAYSLGSKAFVLADMGRFAEAEAGFAEAMEVVRGAQHEVEGSVLCQHAAMCLWQGRHEEALRFAREAETVAVRVHSVFLCAMSRAIGAYARWCVNGHPAAVEALLEATVWLEARGRGLFGSLPYGWLADALARSGDAVGARRYAVRAFRRARMGDMLGEAMAWRSMARLTAGPRRVACLARADAAAAARGSAHEAAANRALAGELAATVEGSTR